MTPYCSEELSPRGCFAVSMVLIIEVFSRRSSSLISPLISITHMVLDADGVGSPSPLSSHSQTGA